MSALSACCYNTIATKSAAPAASSRSVALGAVRPFRAVSNGTLCLSNTRGAGFLGCRSVIAHKAIRRASARYEGLTVRAERSYVMIKPDGVQRGLVGEIIGRFERKGFTIKGLKMFQCPKEVAEEHYRDLKEKPFFSGLVGYIISGPVVCICLEGDGVVASCRKLIGATKPLEAEPGTIRGDLAVQVGRNVVHGSDSPENGERELELWFKEEEIIEWDPTLTPWIIEEGR